MSRRSQRVLVGVLVLALLVAVVVLVRAVVERSSRTPLDEALRMVPGEALRVGFTDWSQARRLTGVARSEDPDRIQELVDAAYERDLSAASALTDGAGAQQEFLGFSPGTVEWEAIAHSREGASLVLRLDDEVDLDDVRSALEESGFDEPATDGGVWKGGADLVAALDPGLGPQFQYVVVLDDQHALVASDQGGYAEEAAAAARGDAESLADADDTDGLTGSVPDPAVSAMLWARDFACEDLSLAKGGPEDQARGATVVEAAGGVSPLSGLLMARLADDRLVVVERYEDARSARDDLEARAKLIVGEAVGRGGSYAEDYELVSSRTDGANVVLTLEGKDDNRFLLSSVHNGPVVFAAC